MADRGMKLLERGLRDMYDAEHRFTDALETMAEQVKDSKLQDGLRRHLLLTKEHKRRLERAFDELGWEPSREMCPVSKGLVDEYERFVKTESPDPATLDTFAAESGMKVEHYEIASYRALVNLAQLLGLDACAKLFRQNLAEEEQAAAEMQSSATRLAADLTGAKVPGVVRQATETMVDQMREGAFVAAGTVKTVGESATRSAGKAIGRVEKRGRRVVRSAQERRSPKSKSKGTGATRAKGRATTTRKTSRSPSSKKAARSRTSKSTRSRSSR